jgi:hypothetical protein
MIVLCLFAFKNVRRIRMVKRENRENQVRSMTKKDFQLLRCLFVQDTVYIFSSTLLLVSYTYQITTKDQIRMVREQALLNFLSTIIRILYDIYFCSSFFVFIIVSKVFRHEFKRIIYKIFGKKLNPIREEENRPDNIEIHVLPIIGIS